MGQFSLAPRKRTSGFNIVWKNIDEDNFYGLKGETGVVPYLIPEGPLPQGEMAGFIEYIGLLKGLLYCWGKKCKGPSTISGIAWRYLINKMVSIHGRPSLQVMIMETAQMLAHEYGQWPSHEVLKNGTAILPESLAVREAFLFSSAGLVGEVKPKFIKKFIEDILFLLNRWTSLKQSRSRKTHCA